ncbi:antibiotic biosynthesis monooxygenase [Saccharopolyspora griseoalba]|uniref:Antibiotic biosynthesis monooxygenase n=1 Tax=Saccharopolyspora griseoalba TaxID=1431848 RepID=A0ABW2LN03_9PSEU
MHTSPDITRPDAELAVIGEWSTGSPEGQRASAQAAVAAWTDEERPRGLLSQNLLLSTDERTVLHYAQWTDEAAYQEDLRTGQPARRRRIDEAVPHIEHRGTFEHRLHRSLVLDRRGRPGCIVAVRFRSDSRETAARFVDTLLDEEPGFARRTDVMPPAGMISNHFHISTDGTHVVNYAEFVDEDAHARIVEGMLQEEDDVPRLIDSTPGLEPLGFKRFTTWLTR